MRIGIFALLLVPAACLAQAITIDADTSWGGDKAIDDKVTVTKGTLTIEPGAKLTFGEKGQLVVGPAGALKAAGTKDKPIELTGKHAGSITFSGTSLLLQQCTITGLGSEDKQAAWLRAVPQTSAVLKDCRISDCAETNFGGGSADVAGCDFRDNRGQIVFRVKDTVAFTNNTLRKSPIWFHQIGKELTIRGNVFVGVTVSGVSSNKIEKVLIEGNYVHALSNNGAYGMVALSGTIRNNVVRGGTWVSSSLGGEVTGNVFEAFTPDDMAAFKAKVPTTQRVDGTHEHICGVDEGTRITRNIFVCPSYGAIMTIGKTSPKCLIRNNTFDIRGSAPLFMNHLSKGDVPHHVVKNNLFVRSGAIFDEMAIADTFDVLDYNLWADCGDKARYRNVNFGGRKAGDEGLGNHDIPAFSEMASKKIAAADVIANPDFKFALSDDDLLARKKSPADCLDLYRKAYTLKKGSPAIDAGDPSDKDDPAVKDAKPDIGAIEFSTQPQATQPESSPATRPAVN